MQTEGYGHPQRHAGIHRRHRRPIHVLEKVAHQRQRLYKQDGALLVRIRQQIERIHKVVKARRSAEIHPLVDRVELPEGQHHQHLGVPQACLAVAQVGGSAVRLRQQLLETVGRVREGEDGTYVGVLGGEEAAGDVGGRETDADPRRGPARGDRVGLVEVGLGVQRRVVAVETGQLPQVAEKCVGGAWTLETCRER